MTDIFFYLTIIPTLAIVLAWHEAGHLIAARLTGVRASVFSIGAGPSLISRYTGRTPYLITPDTVTFHPEGEFPQPGDVVVIHYRRRADGSREALSISTRRDFSAPYRHKRRGDSPLWQDLRERISNLSKTHVTINGQIRRITDGHLILADMQWRIGPIPFAAYVSLPEDPSRHDRATFNSASFPRRAIIMVCGVIANLILPIFALFIIFTMSDTIQAQPITIVEVRPGSPAALAGLRPQDTISVINDRIIPNLEQVQHEFASSDTVTLRIISPDREPRNVTIARDQVVGTFGISYIAGVNHNLASERSPTWVLQSTYQSTVNLYSAFYRAAQDVVQKPQENQLSSAVGFTVHNADVVAKTGLAGWLLMMSILSLSAAIFNILPIPPLDGGKMVFITIEFLRGGNPVPAMYQYAFTTAGIAFIFTVSIMLIIQDMVTMF